MARLSPWRVLARIGAAVALAALAALAVVVLRYVPFDLPSYAAWTGIGIAATSLLCAIRPPRVLGLRRRRWPLLVCIAAAAMAFVAVIWPAPVVHATGPHQRLDDFLPEYQFSEYHELMVEAPVERVAAAVREVTLADMPAAVWLLRMRALAGGRVRSRQPPGQQPVLNLSPRPGSGFLVLDVSDPRELVLGLVGKPWANERPPLVTNGDEFLAFTKGGHVRVAFNLRVADLGAGRVRLSTETRILGNDDEARRIFARYWHLVYPGSAIIRGVWLEAIASRARR